MSVSASGTGCTQQLKSQCLADGHNALLRETPPQRVGRECPHSPVRVSRRRPRPPRGFHHGRSALQASELYLSQAKEKEKKREGEHNTLDHFWKYIGISKKIDIWEMQETYRAITKSFRYSVLFSSHIKAAMFRKINGQYPRF